MKIEDLRKRDNDTCWLCGGFVPAIEATSDHVQPKSQGGKKNNERLAHSNCNHARGNLPYERTLEVLLRVPPGPDHRMDVKHALKVALKAWDKEVRTAARESLVWPTLDEPGLHKSWCDVRWFDGFPPNDVMRTCTCYDT